MKRTTHPPALALCAVALLLGCDPPPPSQERRLIPPAKTSFFDHKVLLMVESGTWRPGAQPWDVASRVRSKLADAFVDTVTQSESRDAIVLIEYAEEKDSSSTASKIPTINTRVSFHVTVLAAADARTLFSASCSATLPGGQSGRAFHEAIQQALEAEPLYASVGWYVSAALGGRLAGAKLLPAVLDARSRAATTDLLERIRFRPADAAEEAILALGRGDIERCRGIGAPAAAPVSDVFRREAPGDPAWGLKLLDVLDALEDPSVVPILVDYLMSRKDHEFFTAGETELLLACLRTVGKLGDAGVVPSLDRFMAIKNTEVAAAAAAVVLQLRDKPPAK